MSLPVIFRSEVTSAGSQTTVCVHGEFDLATEPQFSATAAQAVANDPGSLVIDLRGLTFMDSTGIRALLAVHHSCARRGIRLYLVRGIPAVDRILHLCGLADFFATLTGPAELSASLAA